jgi:hypothetical protein
MVKKPPGGSHQNVDTAAQLIDLRVDVDPAKHGHRTQRQVPAIVAHALLDLRGQFAGGREDQGTNAWASGVPRLACMGAACVSAGTRGRIGRLGRRRLHEALQNGQHKSGGFSGAGLGSGE